MFKDLFDLENFRKVKDNLCAQERRSLKKLSGFNRDNNNPRIILVQDKGSSFVLDFKETCFQDIRTILRATLKKIPYLISFCSVCRSK